MKQIIGDATIYMGDMRDICPTLPKADLCVTDPPYKLTSGGGKTGMQTSSGGKTMNGKFNLGMYNNDGNIVDCDIEWSDFCKPIFDSLKDDAHCYMMCNNRHIQNMLNEADNAGFKFHNMLVWDKVSSTPNRWYMKVLEFTGFFYKGKAFYINDASANQKIKCPLEKNTEHPTQKPISLMEYYIKQSSQKGQLVIDPFLGSGTTGIAALRAGRKFIGIEKTQEYFDLSCKNIERELKQGQQVLL